MVEHPSGFMLLKFVNFVYKLVNIMLDISFRKCFIYFRTKVFIIFLFLLFSLVRPVPNTKYPRNDSLNFKPHYSFSPLVREFLSYLGQCLTGYEREREREKEREERERETK